MKKTFSSRAFAILIFLLILIMVPTVSFAEVAGFFSRVEGNVDILRVDVATPAPVKVGSTVSTGDIVRTKIDSRAEITFKDESTVRLAPETRIKIDEYLFNPDNSRSKGSLYLFRGKLRAIVSKTKGSVIPAATGGSTFDVHTPTTVAGVRGTILFAWYEMGITGIIFKDGQGFVYNSCVPDHVVDVADGQATFVTGPCVEPLPPRRVTDGELIKHTKDTDFGGGGGGHGAFGSEAYLIQWGEGIFGYSEHPDALAKIGYTAGDTRDNTSAKMSTLLPITETNPEMLRESHLETPTDITPPDVTIITPSASSDLSGSDLTQIDITLSSNETSTYFYKLDAGAWTQTGSSLRLSGLAEGSHTLGYTATDPAGNTSMTNLLTFDVSRYSLSGSCGGNLGGGIVSCSDVTGEVSGISNQNWGSWWTSQQTTTIGSTTPPTWTLYLGGTSSDNLTSNNGGYWLEIVNGTASGGILSGTSNFEYLSHDRYGHGTVNITGTYDDYGNYTSPYSSTGTYTESLLSFGGDINGSYYYYEDDSELENYYSGPIHGIFGTTQSPFATPWTPVTLYLMGEGNPYGYITWWHVIEGNDYVDTSSHWRGWMGGITRPDNTVSGMMKALYVDASGNAGILTGNFAGTYYPDLNDMWGAEGQLIASQRATGYDSATFYSYLTWSDPEGDIYGQFAGNNGYINTDDNLQWIDCDSEDDTMTRWFINPTSGKAEPWGIYELELGGNYYNPYNTTSFSMTVGGDTWKDWDDEWIVHISGDWNTNQTIDGSITGRYLTPHAVGSITGSMLGSYDTNSAGTWEAVALGEFTEIPLAFSGEITYDYKDYGLYKFGAYGISYEGSSGGLLGGISPPWTGETPLTYMGLYSGPSYSDPGPFIWTPVIYSYDSDNSTYTTYDGGAFWGLISGVWKDRGIEARVYSLYIDPSGDAGILKGRLSGSYYPELGYNYDSMFEADGTWTPVAIMTGAGLQPSSLGNLISTPVSYWLTPLFSSSGFIKDMQARELKYAINGQDWGIWQVIAGGTYIDQPPDAWNLEAGWETPTDITSIEIAGTQWSNGRLAGSTLGYGTLTASTWISVGETIGTFDPAALTWQAVQMGVFLETNRFLAMTQTTEGQAKLAQLDIPFAEVGRATLKGDDGNLNVIMDNVIFFAYSTGAPSKIWATDNVSGRYNADPALLNSVSLSGSGLNADFIIRQWDTVNNKWVAEVTNGSGTYSGTGTMNNSPVQFNGVAAGTNTGTGPGTFSGTGAGVVK